MGWFRLTMARQTHCVHDSKESFSAAEQCKHAETAKQGGRRLGNGIDFAHGSCDDEVIEALASAIYEVLPIDADSIHTVQVAPR